MIRLLYRCLLWLHPPFFRRQFADEMLWIFDQSAGLQSTLTLFLDGIASLARQWLLRSGSWKVLAALALAYLEVILGGFALVQFAPRHIVLALESNSPGIAEFAYQGSIGRQPLTVGILMYLAVFVIGGLVLFVVGLTYWIRSFTVRRVR